jgi:hypothetical protein
MKQKTQRGYEPVNIIFKISQIYAICNGYRQKLRKIKPKTKKNNLLQNTLVNIGLIHLNF